MFCAHMKAPPSDRYFLRALATFNYLSFHDGTNTRVNQN